MIAAQRVEKVYKNIEEAKKIAGEKVPRVEMIIDGKSVGLAEPHLARAVAMVLKFKKIENEVKEQIESYKEEIKTLLRDAGIEKRPVKLYLKGEGDVIVSKKDATVSIIDAQGLYGVLKKKFFELVSFKAKKGLIELACDGDYPKRDELRKCLEVIVSDEDTVKVTAKRK